MKSTEQLFQWPDIAGIGNAFIESLALGVHNIGIQTVVKMFAWVKGIFRTTQATQPQWCLAEWGTEDHQFQRVISPGRPLNDTARRRSEIAPSASVGTGGCDRLNKPCSQQTPAPSRPRKQTRLTRVAQLEQKLKDLTSQLNTTNNQPEDSTPQWLKKNKSRLLSYDYLFPRDGIHGDEDESTTHKKASESQRSHQSLRTSSSPGAQTTPSWPEAEEAESLLRLFRRKMMPIFPFVIIPPGMTSEQLYMERPFMWKGVMLEATCTDGYRQLNLGRELLKDLSEALLTKPRKSVDLLQGLLLYIAWYWGNLIPELKACLEQMRAFAGTYYIITSVFTTSKRPDAFMNTIYLETVCRILGSRAEYPTDSLLVHLVKVQQLAQSMSVTMSANSGNFQRPQFSILPTVMVVKTLQSQIEDFKASLPADLQDHSGLMAHIHITEALLYEAGLQDIQTETASLQVTERLELLWSLLCALKSFLALRFTQSIAEWPRFPCISSVDFMYAFITCLKLIMLQAPGWDLAFVRQEISLHVLVERQIQDMEFVVNRRKARPLEIGSPGMQADEDPLSRLMSMLKGVNALLRTMPEPTTITPTIAETVTPPAFDDTMFDLDALSGTTPEMWQAMWSDGMYNVNDGDQLNHCPLGFPPRA
ncbi:hypothetical protein SCUP234_12490 [Seiridium cupressi]